jgi:hypothetical protein
MNRSGFNPKARWDRNIPQGPEHARPEELNEKIEVLARFSQGKVLPQEFLWNNKEYKITRVNYSWQERAGLAVISYFSVDTALDRYQISFNNTSLTWRLDKIIA